MKTIITIGSILIVLLTGTLMKLSYDMGVNQGKHNMPEEISLISQDPSKPDTLFGWQDINGEIHIGFKH